MPICRTTKRDAEMRLRLKAGERVEHIASELKVSPRAVIRGLARQGFAVREIYEASDYHAAIARRYRAGERASRIGHDYGICGSRVHQIANAMGIHRKSPPPVKKPPKVEKRCSCCGAVYPATAEHFSPNRADKTGPNPLGLSSHCRTCERANALAYKRKYPGRVAANYKRCLRKLKVRVLTAYSCGPSPQCECCGEGHIEFLSIDHVHGDGASHRKKVGSKVYSDLYRRRYPPGFRVLCMNCNTSHGFWGYCPHKEAKTDWSQFKADAAEVQTARRQTAGDRA